MNIQIYFYFSFSSSSYLFRYIFFLFCTIIIAYCYIELSFGCCETRISPYVGLIQGISDSVNISAAPQAT